MISYGKQSIDQSDIDAVISVLKADWLTQGPEVEAYEDKLKYYFGSKYEMTSYTASLCCTTCTGFGFFVSVLSTISSIAISSSVCNFPLVTRLM